MTVSHHAVSRFNLSLLPGLKATQTADYVSRTAGEEVTHHTVEIRLNKLFFGCPGVATQTCRAVSHGPLCAGLGCCRGHFSAREFAKTALQIIE